MIARRVFAVTALAGVLAAPAEIQLWNAGENPTDYGVHVWNERSIAEVTARYQERGNPLLVDVEHNGAALETGEPAVTAGYARLEVRSGAPWLVFEWSDYGRQQIASGQRRFLSPEYDVDKDTGEILALYRVSLVADPGTHRARMLAAALQGEKQMDLAVILAALRAALAAEDPAVAKESIGNLLAELEKGAGGGGDAPADPGVTAADPTADDDDKDKDPPMTTAADDEDDKEKKPETAKAKAARKTASEGDAVRSATAGALRQIEDAQRDHLMLTRGERLEPSIRRWAEKQPLAVVKGLLDAAPEKISTGRAKPTRGSGTGGASLSDRERQICAAKKIDPAKYAETRDAIKARSNGTGA